MRVPVTIPRYHSKDLTVLALSMLPLAVMLNYLLYGSRLFTEITLFTSVVGITFVYLALVFVCCGYVAVSLRNRFPADRDIFKRILVCLGIFYLMSAAFISFLLLVFDISGLFGYHYKEVHFFRAYVTAVLINTFLTFFNEGIYRFEKLKETVTQTERLKKEYMQSRLLGLKSQVNPHFLFNSLNTLSSLIQENGDHAETFLDHMSKVYRYLLRHRDERLVSLRTELDFITSYYYLLRQRYNEGISLSVNIPERQLDKMIAPLTLQMIVENTVNTNMVSRSCPLSVSITADETALYITNSICAKMNAPAEDKALGNITSKYGLITREAVSVEETGSERVITIPLITNAATLMA